MLEFSLNDSVAVLCLDDGKANPLGHGLIGALHEALDRAEREARAVLIEGRKGVFSAGFDLKEIGKGPAEASALVDAGGRLLLRLFKHPQPVVSACTGHALAAGALLLLASDTRLGAVGDWKIGLNETAIGMALPVFGLEIARAGLASHHLPAAAVRSELYGPEEARAVGYLDRTVAAEELHEQALTEAARLAELDAAAYAANKLGVRRPYVEAIEASFD